MAWIEVHQALLTHRKTLRLARIMGIDKFAVIGRLVALWQWSLDNAPDGNIDGDDTDLLADVMGWNDEPSQLVSSLLSAGFLDVIDGGYHIHDWQDYAGRLIEKREANAEKQRRWRDTHKSEAAPHVTASSSTLNSSSNHHVTVTLPSRDGATVPNRTQPNTTVPDYAAAPSESEPEPTAKVIPFVASAASAAPPQKRTPAKAAETKPASPKPKVVNPYWDMFVEVLGHDAEPSKRGAWGKAIHDIKQMGGNPEDIKARAQIYQVKFAGMALTPTALAGNWHLCKPLAPTSAEEKKRYDDPATQAEVKRIEQEILDLARANGTHGQT